MFSLQASSWRVVAVALGSPARGRVASASVPRRWFGISNDLLVSASMAHGGEGNTQASMVDELKKSGGIVSEEVENAMRHCDRVLFTPPGFSGNAYANAPISLNAEAASMTTPFSHAYGTTLSPLPPPPPPPPPPLCLPYSTNKLAYRT